MLLVMLSLPLVIRLGYAQGWVATPNHRSMHVQPIPQLGGIGIFFSSLIVSITLFADSFALAFWLPALMLFLLGVIDDLTDLAYKSKLAVQVLACGFCAVAIVGPASWDGGVLLALFVATGFAVGVTNAINLADGLDGLASGLTLISALAFAAVASQVEQTGLIILLGVVVGSLLGFLRFNAHPAAVFMGDGGAYFLGITLAYASLVLFLDPSNSVSAISVLLLLGVPLVDIARVVCDRLLHGRSPFEADRSHLHHRLIDQGCSKSAAVVNIYGLHCLFVICGVVFSVTELPGAWFAYALLIGLVLQVCNRGGLPPDLVQRLLPVDRSSPPRMLHAIWPAGALSVLLCASALSSRDIGIDFVVVSIVLALVLSLGYFAKRAELSWLDRFSIYALAAYTLYFTHGAGLGWDWSVFLLLGVWLSARLLTDHGTGFELNPTDVLMLVLAIGAVWFSQSGSAVHTFVVMKALIIFYTLELLLNSGLRHLRAVRAVAVAGFALIAFRGLTQAAIG